MMACKNILLICLGSNASNKEYAVETAAEQLRNYGTIIADSGAYLTSPEDVPTDCRPYWNRIVRLETDMTVEGLQKVLKEYETNIRSSHCGTGVAIDLDIVADSMEILRPRDFRSAYFQKGLKKLNKISSFKK